MKIADEGGVFVLTMTHLGSERLVATVPTGSRAAYPEAIARGLAEANVKVDAHIASYRTVYANLVVADGRGDQA